MTTIVHKLDGTEVVVEIREMDGEWADCYEVCVEGFTKPMTPLRYPVDVRKIAKKVKLMIGDDILEALGEQPSIANQLTWNDEDGELTEATVANADATGDTVKAEVDKVLLYMGQLDERQAAVKVRRDSYVSRFDKQLAAIARVRSFLLWKYDLLFKHLSDAEGKGKTKKVVTDHGTVSQTCPAKGKWELRQGADEAKIATALFKAGMKEACDITPKLVKSGLDPAKADEISKLTGGFLVYTPPVSRLNVKTIGTPQEQETDE